MSEKNPDEMEFNDLVDLCINLQIELKGQRQLIQALRDELVQCNDRKNGDYAAANVAVGAIYRMVDLIRSVPVTHAQREGNLLLLIAFINRAWPSHNGMSRQIDDASDIPY